MYVSNILKDLKISTVFFAISSISKCKSTPVSLPKNIFQQSWFTSCRELFGVDDFGSMLLARAQLDTTPHDWESPPEETDREQNTPLNVMWNQKTQFKTGLKGHKYFIFGWTVKKNNSYPHLPPQIRNEYNSRCLFDAQIFMRFTWEQNVEHTLSFKRLTESIFRKTRVMKITWDSHDNGLMSFLTG